MVPTHTITSLSGTLAKRTKPTLKPNFVKELVRVQPPTGSGFSFSVRVSSNGAGYNTLNGCATTRRCPLA